MKRLLFFLQEQERIDREKRKLREMEAKHFETEQLLETSARDEEELLLERFKKEHEQLEVARKHFDDLEFQQLEVKTSEQECIPVGCVPTAAVSATRCQY